MRISVQHQTLYRYEVAPRRVMQLLRLTPREYDGQIVGSWQIDVNCDADLIRKRDAYGNITHLLTVEQPPNELLITAEGHVDTVDTSGVVTGLDEPLVPTVYRRPTHLSRVDEGIVAFAREATEAVEGALAKMHALLAALHAEIRFEPGTTDVHTTAREAWQHRAGVCQDLAHLFCGAARSLNVPTRYVGGHLLRRDGQNRQPAAHAWAEAYIEDLGWTAFDPAHGISTDEHYVRVSSGLDYRTAAPIVGTRMGGGTEDLTVTAETSRKMAGRAARQSQSQSHSGSAMGQSQNQ